MNLTHRELAIRYVAFAAVATAANLLVQHLSLMVYHRVMAVEASIFAGTAVGFVAKYVLDKRYIFFDPTRAPADELGRMMLYGVTGVLTTLLFWGSEIGLWRLVGASWAKYMGAVIGLSIGYWAKYQLDRRFVFARPAPPC